MGLSFVAVLRPAVKLLGMARRWMRELVLLVLYFLVLGLTSIIRKARKDPFKGRLSTWEPLQEGDSALEDHLSKF